MIVCERVELQRNPKKSKEEIDQILKDCFHLKKIIWMKEGVIEDQSAFLGKLPIEGNVFNCGSTGGHVDEVS